MTGEALPKRISETVRISSEGSDGLLFDLSAFILRKRVFCPVLYVEIYVDTPHLVNDLRPVLLTTLRCNDLVSHH